LPSLPYAAAITLSSSVITNLYYLLQGVFHVAAMVSSLGNT
jgi:hypothetical protein